MMRGARERLTGVAGRGRGRASSRNCAGAAGVQGGATGQGRDLDRVGARPRRGHRVDETLQQQVEGAKAHGCGEGTVTKTHKSPSIL